MSNLANLTICKLTTNSQNPVPLLDANPADAFINWRIRIRFWIFEITPFGRCATLLGIEFSGRTDRSKSSKFLARGT